MRGIWTALVTPFNDQNQLDLDSYRKILRDQLNAGVKGVIPCGTTGESPTLSKEEKKTLIQVALEELKGSSVQVAPGTGSNDTQDTIEFSKWAAKQGAQGIVVVTPYYNKPSQAGLESHFLAIANAVPCEITLYNVPGRTGVSFSAETIARLSTHPRIRSLKEATGNVAFTSEILEAVRAKKSSIDILSGDDATYLPLLSVGAVGVISVASNLFPRAMVKIQLAMETGNLNEALKLHQHYYPLFRDLFIESNPVPVKYALEKIGLCKSHVRAPLTTLSKTSQDKLDESLKRCEISPGKSL